MVARHALPVGIHEPKIGLRDGVALLGQRTKDAQRGRVIAFKARRNRIFDRIRKVRFL